LRTLSNTAILITAGAGGGASALHRARTRRGERDEGWTWEEIHLIIVVLSSWSFPLIFSCVIATSQGEENEEDVSITESTAVLVLLFGTVCSVAIAAFALGMRRRDSGDIVIKNLIAGEKRLFAKK
jgi:uncharacterized membrane protein YbhN (UPF0104 family)